MLKFLGAEFDWDAANTSKCLQHGVSIVEIEIFFTGDIQIVYDIKHSQSEQRLIAVGLNADSRPMFVVFAIRYRCDKPLIRPISARFMHLKEAFKYEKTRSKV